MTPNMLFIALAAVAGCASRGIELQTVELETLEFSAPAGWERIDRKTRDAATAQWTPEENGRKESLVVIRSMQPATSKADRATLERLLAGAQRNLPKARIRAISPVTSNHGFIGLTVEVTFVPQGLQHEYHRVHTVLVDGSALVNVIYTARDSERSREVVGAVLGSLRHQEG